MTQSTHPARLVDDLLLGGHALSRTGLVTAFGHLSGRAGENRVLITPPMALGRLTPDSAWTALDLDAHDLPRDVPKEAWIHVAVARRRPDVGGICRAQPPVATALASAGVPILPLHGQGAYLGPTVPVFDDATLVRDEDRAVDLAQVLGDAPAVLMRGNGAVTVGSTVGEAVARMWVLEASARMNSIAAAAGRPTPISAAEQAAWQQVASEILGRIWADLRDPGPTPPTTP
ncbi:MAG: class II aldolase/adducin family protein [Actinomycetales bacterium]